MNKKEKFQGQVKIRLTDKEVGRADVYEWGRGKSFTIISRKQSDGTYIVAAIEINTGRPIGVGGYDFIRCDSKADIRSAINELLDDLDVLGGSSKLPSRGRDRRYE